MNKIMQEQILRCYNKRGLKAINEFCVLTCISLIDAYTYIASIETDEEVVKWCNNKVSELKNFYRIG